MSKEDDVKELYATGWMDSAGVLRMPAWAIEYRWHYHLWLPWGEEPLEKTLRRYCESFLAARPDKQYIGADGSPYLSRYCLASLEGIAPEDMSGKIYLDHFHRGDDDPELHNHPWDRSLSLILVNGYDEERRIGEKVRPFVRRPGDVVSITADTFHRVDVPLGEAWTLFFTGKYVQTWHFWSRETGVLTPWRAFIQAKGLSV